MHIRQTINQVRCLGLRYGGLKAGGREQGIAKGKRRSAEAGRFLLSTILADISA